MVSDYPVSILCILSIVGMGILTYFLYVIAKWLGILEEGDND